MGFAPWLIIFKLDYALVLFKILLLSFFNIAIIWSFTKWNLGIFRRKIPDNRC